MPKSIIVKEKSFVYPNNRKGGRKIINEEELSLVELISKGRFFSKCCAYIPTVEGVKETLNHSGWIIFTKTNNKRKITNQKED